MNLAKVLFSLIFFCSSLSFAVLNLEAPETLLKKASENRQQLRDVIMSIEMQMPEMRDHKTFESYFFIMDKLREEADRQDLDDIFPGAVKALGTKMAGFGVKWLDLTLKTAPEKLNFYIKYMDIEAYSNLLSYSTYYSKKITDPTALRILAENTEYIILNGKDVISTRLDIEVGYRDLISSIAVTFLTNPMTTEEEKAYWAGKIYTSQGLNYFTDTVQKMIYNLKPENKSDLHKVIQSLNTCYQISDRIIDAPTTSNQDRIDDLFVEAFRKSFELVEPFSAKELNLILAELNPRHLQALSYFLTTAPDVVIFNNSQTLLAMGQDLLQALANSSLVTDAYNFNLFLGKVSASLKLRDLDGEGTYRLKDKEGEVWKLTIIRSKPFEVIAALANEKWQVHKSYMQMKFSPSQDLFIAGETGEDVVAVETNSFNPSVSTHGAVTFKIESNGKISFSDVFGPEKLQNITGERIEKVSSILASPKELKDTLAMYEGQIQFEGSEKSQLVQLSIQSDGLVVNGTMRDKYGVFYNFVSGYFNKNNEFTLTTGKFRETTWAQVRGTITDGEIKARIIVGGRGYITKEFNLKRKGQ